SVCRAAPVAASQSRTVLSSGHNHDPEPDATVWPSGEKATALTDDVWPSSVCRAAPVAASQSRTVLSSDHNHNPEPDGTNLPSGTDATWPTDDVTPASDRTTA